MSAISTTAVLSGNKYILNGTKSWVTCGPVGKSAIVFATIDKSLKHRGITAFLVPLPTDGVTFGKSDEKLGIRASPTCNLILENVQIPKDYIIGRYNLGNMIKLITFCYR